MTIAERLFKVLKPFLGAADCIENRHKIRTLVKEELPQISDEDLETAMDGF